MLSQLGRTPNPQGLVVRFETREFFKTYTQERNPSFRTNCLVLKALLDLLPGNSEQSPQIEKTVGFITNYWWTTNGEIEDLSNTSLNYPIMLMVDVLVRLLDLWEGGFAPILDDLPLRDKVFICLYQALTRTLQDQNDNGSWGRTQRCESTAYAVLILTKLAPLSSAPRVKSHLCQAIDKARKFLADNFRPLSEPDLVWKGKTTAGSSVIFQAYVLAALQAPIIKSSSKRSIESRFEMSLARIAIQTKYYARQSWFANVPEWQIQACLVESNLFLPQLKDVRYAVFPQSDLKDDQYFETIPFIWLAASNFDRRFIGPEFLYQMMILTFLNRQLDDYVTNIIAETFAGCLFEVVDILHNVFDELEHYTDKDQCYCDNHDLNMPRSSVSTNATAPIADARIVLHRFISHILNHPYVLMASHHDQSHLRSELLGFLLGSVNQLPDQQPGSASVAGSSGSHSESDQTHHTYTFNFLSCLVGNQSLKGSVGLRRDFLDTPEQQYLAAAMCRHISIVSFMSSTALDQPIDHIAQQPTPVKSRISSFGMDKTHSRSVSSVSSSSSTYSHSDISPISAVSSNSSVPSTSPSSEDFPLSAKQSGSQSHDEVLSQSLQLTRLLSHERKCLNVCLQSLDAASINQPTANILGLFVDLSELSGLIFRDSNIGSCYQPTTAVEVIEEACTLSTFPMPPEKAKQRGSVAAARAALATEPLALSRNPSSNGTLCSEKPTLISDQEKIEITGTTTLQREWNWNRPIPTPHVRRTSRSSIEMARIECIMSEMGDSSRTTLPKPKINPMRKENQQNRPRAATEGQSVYSLPMPPFGDLAHKRVASADSTNVESTKLAKARAQVQRKLNGESQRKASIERHAREANEVDAQRRRASSLQAKAMAEATRAMSVHEPMPKRHLTAKEVKKDTSPKAEVKIESNSVQEKGWVKAPPAEGVGKPIEKTQAKKLHRASRLGGPRLKLPF